MGSPAGIRRQFPRGHHFGISGRRLHHRPARGGDFFAGGIVSWLVIMPAIKFFGQLAGNTPLYPSTIPIPLMTPDDMWRSYIRPMGAGPWPRLD